MKTLAYKTLCSLPFCSLVCKKYSCEIIFQEFKKDKKTAFHADYEDDENVAIGSYKKETDQKNFVYNKTQKTV